MDADHSYKTLDAPSAPVLFKDRKSKFYGFAYPLRDEAEVKPIIATLQKQYPAANHFCYAWRLGTETHRYRTNDDGEPKHTAGMPIYRQLEAFGLSNVLVVVVRIFGGTKLGKGGLVNAYGTAAKMVLDTSEITLRHIVATLELRFDYGILNPVMRTIKRYDIVMVSQQMEQECTILVTVQKNKLQPALNEFQNIPKLKVNHY